MGEFSKVSSFCSEKNDFDEFVKLRLIIRREMSTATRPFLPFFLVINYC